MRIRSLAGSALVLATSAAMVLTGCGSDSKGGGSSAPGLGSQPGSGSGSAAGNQTYTIGFQGALSGENQQLGINEVNSFKLAIKQANAKGDLGFKLLGAIADDAGDNAKSPPAAQKLIGNASVIGVVGPIFSGPTSAVGETYGAANMALISPSATNEDLTKSGFTTFHRIVPTDGVEGAAASKYLAKNFKNVFVVDDTTVYGKGVADVVAKGLEDAGIKVQRQGVPDDTTDYGAISTTVAGSGADAMFYGGYYSGAGLFAKALVAAGFKGLAMSGNGAKDAAFVTGAGKDAEGWQFSCGCQDATTAPEAADFKTAYESAYGTPPSTYSPEAYDATNAMIEAIKTAAEAGSVTRQSIEDAVTNLDYTGITTQVKFASTGEVAQATVNLYEVKGGKIAQLGNIADQ